MGFQLDRTPNKKHKSTWDLDRLLKTEIPGFGTLFGTQHKEAFYTELHLLLTAGLPLKDALVLLAQEQKKQANLKILEAMVLALEQGKSFAETLDRQKVFTRYEYHSIKIGEETANLQKVSKELGLYFKRRNDLKNNTRNALSYPIVVFITAVLAILFMLRFVVPMFAEIFQQNKVELPALTKGVLAVSKAFQAYYLLFFTLLVLLFFGVKILSKKLWFQKYSASILLKIPALGTLVRKSYLAQFTQAVALLVGAKIPLLTCVQLTKEMLTFYPLQQALQDIEQQLLSGATLSESLQKFSFFDSKMRSLIKVAEETHQYEFIFERLANQYHQEVQQQSKMLSTLLEPLIIVFLGIAVALVLIAMYLPMFQLSTVIG